MLLRAGFNEYFNGDECLKSKTLSKEDETPPTKEGGDKGESVPSLNCIDKSNPVKNSELFNYLSFELIYGCFPLKTIIFVII